MSSMIIILVIGAVVMVMISISIVIGLYLGGVFEGEKKDEDSDDNEDDVSEEDTSTTDEDISEDDVSEDDVSEDDVSEDDVSEDDVSEDTSTTDEEIVPIEEVPELKSTPPPVPVDCEVSEWDAWSDCINGKKARTRKILKKASNGGHECPVLQETQNCYIVSVTFKGATGKEKYELFVNGKKFKSGTASKTYKTYTTEVKVPVGRVKISRLNDISSYSITLKDITVNGISIKQNVNADEWYKDDEKRRKALLEGNLYWKGEYIYSLHKSTSCYGARKEDNCFTCQDVLHAYRSRWWRYDRQKFDQCKPKVVELSSSDIRM